MQEEEEEEEEVEEEEGRGGGGERRGKRVDWRLRPRAGALTATAPDGAGLRVSARALLWTPRGARGKAAGEEVCDQLRHQTLLIVLYAHNKPRPGSSGGARALPAQFTPDFFFLSLALKP